MAQKMLIQLIDDLTGETGSDDLKVETVNFGLDGATYEIDLTESNSSRLRESLAEFVENARRSGPRGKSSTAKAGAAPKAAGADYDAKAVRTWAEANGVQIPARGRVPKDVLEQYRNAGN